MPPTPVPTETLDTALQGILYRAVDDGLAAECARSIDDRTFALVLRLTEHQDTTNRLCTPDQIRGAALLVGANQEVALAMLGFLRSPVTGFYHSIHDHYCGTLVVDDDRPDVMRALYVHRACCPEALIGDVMLRSQAEEWGMDMLRGPLYSGDPIRDVALYQRQMGRA